ncbi:MAG: hypothetical protein WC500_04080 [Candidatus Margulisiibacteriota bacterium]
MLCSIFARHGNPIKIGNCVSGTLSAQHDQVKRRIALATETAWQTLDRPEVKDAFLRDLQRKFFHVNQISEPTFAAFNFLTHTFENGKGLEFYGLCHQDKQELKDFSEAFQQLTWVSKGAHRRLFLAITGVMADPSIDELETPLYCAMLGKMDKEHGGPSFSSIVSVAISEQLAEDKSIANQTGTKSLIFSLARLSSYGYQGIPTLPSFMRRPAKS